MTKRPPITAPAGLKRVDAALHIGVSVGKLDDLVQAGILPPPKQLGRMRIYSRADLDKAIEAAPYATDKPALLNPDNLLG